MARGWVGLAKQIAEVQELFIDPRFGWRGWTPLVGPPQPLQPFGELPTLGAALSEPFSQLGCGVRVFNPVDEVTDLPFHIG
jgi:hypothetical protein